MKFESFQAESGQFIFRFETREVAFFRDLLLQYPMQHGAQRSISADAPADEIADEQHLLEESLNEYRQKQRQELETFLGKDGRLVQEKNGWKLILDGPGIDWLLQILNDIRVGSWVQLGRPDMDSPARIKSVDHLRHATSLELCGMLQSVFLNALQRGK